MRLAAREHENQPHRVVAAGTAGPAELLLVLHMTADRIALLPVL